MKKTEKILSQIKKEDIKFIELEFTDIFGNLKAIDIPADSLEEAITRGVWFDGSSIEGFARIMESDMFLKPDLNTYAIISDEDSPHKTARFLCNVYTPTGKLFEGDPRGVLKKIIKEAAQEGYQFFVGPEVEFYLLKRTEDGFMIPEYDTGSYFDCNARDVSTTIRKEIMVAMRNFNITSERGHHEVGEGQHEIGFRYGDPLETADRVITLKRIIRTIANKHNLIASFMPKPLFGKAGNGMHIHFSMFDRENHNLFYDKNDKQHLSNFAKHFIAGELAYVKEMCAVLNPTVNSYKRLVPGYEAPVYICWGNTNRSALIRIPRFSKGRESSVRAELRNPDTSASPYLAFAAMLKAGLEGVKKEFPLMPISMNSMYEKTPEELVKEGIDTLPRSLEEAISLFKESQLMKELFGNKLHAEYTLAKEAEVERFRISVTDWEKKEYLEHC